MVVIYKYKNKEEFMDFIAQNYLWIILFVIVLTVTVINLLVSKKHVHYN